MHKSPLIVSGLIFLFLSLVHLKRLIEPFQVRFGDYVVPEWASLAGFLFFLALAIWNFSVAKGCCHSKCDNKH